MTTRNAQNHLGPRFPLAAVVGNDLARRALMLLAVDPGLRGLILSGPTGTGKSILARSLTSLLPTNSGQAAVTFVELPLNTTEDRLLGGIDIEATLATGCKHTSRGLLAEADGGLLLVDDINLLEESLAANIAAALESGRVRVEREGVTESHPAEFLLLGTFNPDEGAVSRSLRDRVGLFVDLTFEADALERVEIASRALDFQEDPLSLSRTFGEQTLTLKRSVEEARRFLGRVLVSNEAIRNVAAASMRLGVEGNRPDVFATRAARASAALAGRDEITEVDIITAIQLVLLPRATSFPEARESEEPAAPPLDRQDRESEASGDLSADAIQDLIIQAQDALAPLEAMTSFIRARWSSSAGRRTQRSGFREGRYVRSVQRRTRSCYRVAIDATLRTAAPHQRWRRERSPQSPARLKITAGDLRYKKINRRAGMLFIFVVDASGSMVANRMAQAKGALTRLLQEAYLHRDRVALIGFRGQDAQVLLAPTRSVELGKHLVDALPAGGATPLAAGLLKALDVAAAAGFRDSSEVMLLLFTDGRANVGLRRRVVDEPVAGAEEITEELRQIGAVLRHKDISSVVIDTKSKFVSSGEGQALAELLGGRYLYLPRPDEHAIYEAVTVAAREIRKPPKR